ncbi:sulfotransferase [Jannaschia sp. W003]|uniref:sulfotransferase n=1 Tax=Jannaschia sp. W003 TaxID=2867012 RepID=UPI0021A27CEC|nr:sulfotransferase [Jannaschia sp. W003]UWQ20895.1 sulfotransferase [Jannaschia sp. W003]
MIHTLKVYGERNTGTNYLAELLVANFDRLLLRGTQPLWPARRALVHRLGRMGLAPLGRAVDEATSDLYFARAFPRTLGWKHAEVPVERLARATPGGVGFVVLTKNPYSFLLSLHRRPYHLGAPVPDLATFLARPVRPARREMSGRAPCRPAEIWNRKMRSYERLAASGLPAVVLRYEDLLADEAGALGRIAEAFGLPMSRRWAGVTYSTKDPGKGRADYRDRYLREQWREDLDADTVAAINTDLDADLAARFGYDVIDPAAVGRRRAA